MRQTPRPPPSAATEVGLIRTNELWQRARDSWISRSLLVGAGATAIDVAVLLLMVRLLRATTPVAAMTGVLVGGTFAFLANRRFAFRATELPLLPQAIRYAVATGAAMLVHAALVTFLADRVGISVVLAKLAADLLVFSVGQLLVLRFFVFVRGGVAEARALEGETPVVLAQPSLPLER